MTRRNRSSNGTDLFDTTLLGEVDLHLFNEGTHHHLYRKLGAHPVETDGTSGTVFGVWAPNARAVHVIGDFNDWSKDKHPLTRKGSSGIWEGFIAGVGSGALYKYHITSEYKGYTVDKADPIAFRQEVSPRTASMVWDLAYEWGDDEWIRTRKDRHQDSAPLSIYELHLGSWMRETEENNRFLTYREIAPKLVNYVQELGFTHVELLPVMEHPFFGSWGYQVTSYFAPTSRYGTPQDLMFLVDLLHQNGIGVILDWVPAHFPSDEHGIGYFDGTHLYEHSDPRQGKQPDWGTLVFNYGRQEVISYLTSSAFFWLDVFHADGLRVDGVASMLYLDYSRKAGEWMPNEFGGRENLEAIRFLRHLNDSMREEYGDTIAIAEESTAWPMVSRPTAVGGLGFHSKWDMGWMHDTLAYMARDPLHRKYHHNQLTFRTLYAFQENFVLPFSHDEVVYGKGSLLQKMAGDEWSRFANLRLLYGYMYSVPGKKLLFMGQEFGQIREWDHDGSLDWHLLQEDSHRGLQKLVSRLNELYRQEPSLHTLDFDSHGFSWIDANDSDHSVISYMRHGGVGNPIIVVCNFTPVPRLNYRVGVDKEGFYRELMNTDGSEYGGSGHGNMGGIEAAPVPFHGRKHSLNLTVPPLAALYLTLGAES